MATRTLLIVLLTQVLSGNAFAAGPRGVHTYQFTVTGGGYVACLSEMISFTANIEARGHVFETKNGTVHILDNYTETEFITGLSTGREWIGKGVSPFQSSVRVDGSGVTQWVVNVRSEPVVKGDPMMLYQNRFKMTVNANGELIVEHLDLPGTEGIRCLPAQ